MRAHARPDPRGPRGHVPARAVLIVVPDVVLTAISFEFPPPGYSLGYYRAYFTGEDWLDPHRQQLRHRLRHDGPHHAAGRVPAAFGYVRYRFRGKSLVNLLIMSPLIVPHVVSALGYYGYLGLGQLDRHPPRRHPRPHVARGAGTFLVICATLKGYDRNLERAAMISGAGPLANLLSRHPAGAAAGHAGRHAVRLPASFNEAVVALFIGGRDAATLPKKMFESIRLESDPVIAVVSALLVGAVAARGPRLAVHATEARRCLPISPALPGRSPPERATSGCGISSSRTTAARTRSTTSASTVEARRVRDLAGAERLRQDDDAHDDRRLRGADPRRDQLDGKDLPGASPTSATSASCSRTTRCSRT